MEVQKFYPCGQLHPDFVKSEFEQLDYFDQENLIKRILNENDDISENIFGWLQNKHS